MKNLEEEQQSALRQEKIITVEKKPSHFMGLPAGIAALIIGSDS
jgi:hypothetical protein